MSKKNPKIYFWSIMAAIQMLAIGLVFAGNTVFVPLEKVKKTFREAAVFEKKKGLKEAESASILAEKAAFVNYKKLWEKQQKLQREDLTSLISRHAARNNVLFESKLFLEKEMILEVTGTLADVLKWFQFIEGEYPTLKLISSEWKGLSSKMIQAKFTMEVF